MKKLIFTLVIALLGSVISFAQVEEAGKPMTAGVENSLNIRLLNANEKDVEKLWKAHIKSYKGKTKKDRKSGETFTDNALVPEISSNTIDLYAKTSDVGNEVLFTVWFDLGGEFLSSTSHPDKYGQAEKMLLLFALKVSEKVISDELSTEEGTLKKQEKDLVKLEKENTNLHKEIETYKQKILAAEAAIETNLANQENTKVTIEKQKEVVGKVKKKLETVKN
jgi:hypothetical protein